MNGISAEECLKFAIRKLEDILSSEAGDQSGATELSGVSSEVRSLQKMLEHNHGVLMNAQANWASTKEADAYNYFCKGRSELQREAKNTETAVFNFMKEVADIKPSTVPDIFKSMNPKPVNFFALHKLMDDVQEIKSRLKMILMYHLGTPGFTPITESVRQSLQTRSVVQVVGTDVFAKTTHAEKLFQSTEVKGHFEVCFWLFPQIRLNTQDDDPGLPNIYMFKPIDILRKMLLKLGDTNLLDAHNEGYIMSQLHQSMNGKRCLVVVDNNWPELWNLVNTAFADGNNGSRVLTIISSEQRQSDYKFDLPFLNNQDSFKLLKELGKNYFLELEYDKTLFNKGDVEKWYSELPTVLKMCIAYTAAVFPCGSIVLADSLIQLWIVEGIIPHEEERTMENIAESYLHQLVERGSLRIVQTYYHNQANHPIRSIILHPSLHRIFNLEAQKIIDEGHHHYSREYDGGDLDPVRVKLSVVNTPHHSDNNKAYYFYNDIEGSYTRLHRLALHLPYQFNRIFSFGEIPKQQRFRYPSLHSLFFFGYVERQIKIYPFIFLRVLTVFSSHIRFPEEYTPCWLDALINLRYLGFIVCLVEGESLGKTLDHLGKLEILDLSGSIVSGLCEFIKNNKKVNVLGPVKDELPESWSPVPDMSQ